MSDLGVQSRHVPSGVAAWWAPDTLRSRGERPALHLDGAVVSYGTLAMRVETRVAELGAERRLVALAGGNDLEFIVTYLAALAAGHPLILLPPGSGEADLLATYRPDVLVRTDPSTCDIDRRRADEPRDLHPDLALLLTTSGSTGTRKLVRLSSDNIATNALQIADYLRLSAGDVGITSLPLHYCYGLSVLNSHLAAGASVVVTTSSVVDPCFWDAVRRVGVTNLAGVPHTFELIERIGVATLDAPSLRAVMQAGGRMPPEAVRRFSELGVRYGWDFYVMYGQTEATARMAYLPPDLAQLHPAAIGIPVPGGSFDLADVPETAGLAVRPGEAVGELVYRGPNVMLGYAEGPADLAAGRVVDELRTGDLARRDTDGLYTIVGRRSRFIKVHGHRIDLGEVERIGREAVDAGPSDVVATGRDERLLIATCTGDPAVLRRHVAARLGMPARVIGVAALDELPRTERGKPDYAAISSAVEQLDPAGRGTGTQGVDADGLDGVDGVACEFAAVLDRPVSPDDTFVGLGGDSFSYVELSVRLEERLADLPADWHLQPVGALARLPRRRSRLVAVETSVVLRAVGILLIVCTHMHLYRLPAGAHLLLAVAGFNFARFQLAPGAGHRLRRGLATVGRVAIPTTAWIGINMAIAGGYSLGALFLVNNYFGSPWRRDGRWQYWYFEAFVQIVLVLVIVFAIPAVRRVEARYPFGVAGVVLGASLLLRFEVVQLGDDYNAMFRPHTVLCFFALGWCAQRAVAVWQKVAVTAAAALTVFGYFDQQFDRELRIALAVVALVWVARVPLPRLLARGVGVLAATSMYIFLVHWQVWPVLDRNFEDHVAFVLTVAVGVVVGLAADRAWRGAREIVGRSWSARSVRSSTSVSSASVSSARSSTSMRSEGSTDQPLRTV